MAAVAALLLIVSAGDFDRIDCPIAVAMSLADLGPYAQGLDTGRLMLIEKGPQEPVPIRVQWDNGGEPNAAKGHLVFILPGKTPKGTTRTFALSMRGRPKADGGLEARVEKDRHIEIAQGGKPVLRYNFGLMKQFPDKPSKFDRACYFHPLWAPCGEVLTGDFHPNHAHHRGLWFAWVKAKAGPVDANFWEVQQGRGKMVNQGIRSSAGQVFASFAALNHWVSRDKVLLHEMLRTRVYAMPGGIRVFDLDDEQTAVEADLTLGKIHYGGLGLRGRDDWDGKQATLDVLTSEGKQRKNSNATNARWFDYTGPLGKDGWGGALVLEHPENPRYPNRLRIHPTMCFASTTLCQTEPYTVKKGATLRLRYRIVLHDGKPDKALAERLAADFATPPTVTWRKAQ